MNVQKNEKNYYVTSIKIGYVLTHWPHPTVTSMSTVESSKDTYPGWQWAAVITYLLVINTPPHLFFVNNPSHVASRTNTCQGHSPNVAPLPPTILPCLRTKGLIPHSAS